MPRRDTVPTKQAGEYLVAAELARAGATCATFAGNVRHFDLIASGPGGYVPIQVKAKRAGDWQLDIGDFAEISFDGDKQIVGRPKPEPVPGLFYVFVHLSSYGSDEFFVIAWATLRDRVVKSHRAWLATHGGRRPKNPSSTHTTIDHTQLADHRNRWSLIMNVVDQSSDEAL